MSRAAASTEGMVSLLSLSDTGDPQVPSPLRRQVLLMVSRRLGASGWTLLRASLADWVTAMNIEIHPEISPMSFRSEDG